MIDIRVVCKIFLDFIYDNEILPNNIIKILEEKNSKWDFRIICDILNYKENCYKKNENDSDSINSIKTRISKERSSLESIKIWREFEDARKLKYLHDAANDFFHNVSSSDDEFIQMIRRLLEKAYLNCDENQYSLKYIKQIDDIIEETQLRFKELQNDSHEKDKINSTMSTMARESKTDTTFERNGNINFIKEYSTFEVDKLFKQYLLNMAYKENSLEHYKQNVTNSYTSAINCVGKKYGKKLWNIIDSKEILDILKNICNENWFLEGDSHKTWSNGIKRYAEFLDYAKDNRIFENVKDKYRQTPSFTNYDSYYLKALPKISKWAEKLYQYNSTIIGAYFRAEEIDGHATKDLMRGLCLEKGMSEQQFNSNYAQMTFDGSNSHGKVFEDDGENVWIWDKIKSEVMKYRDIFLKGNK